MGRAIVFILAAVAGGVAFGLLDAYSRAHGGQGVPQITISTGALGFAVVVLSIFTVFAGNKSIAWAGKEAEATAKAFAPEANGSSVVYIFRDAFYARFLGLELSVDDRSIGQTRGKTFFCLSLAPGTHRISAVNPQDNSRAELDVILRAGICYVEQTLKLGAKGPKHGLAICDVSEAQPRIRRCRMLLANAELTNAA